MYDVSNSPSVFRGWRCVHGEGDKRTQSRRCYVTKAPTTTDAFQWRHLYDIPVKSTGSDVSITDRAIRYLSLSLFAVALRRLERSEQPRFREINRKCLIKHRQGVSLLLFLFLSWEIRLREPRLSRSGCCIQFTVTDVYNNVNKKKADQNQTVSLIKPWNCGFQVLLT